MAHSNQIVSPLRQRMIDDMVLHKLNLKTQKPYGNPPNTVTAEELRLFQLHMAESGVSNTSINATIWWWRFRKVRV